MPKIYRLNQTALAETIQPQFEVDADTESVATKRCDSYSITKQLLPGEYDRLINYLSNPEVNGNSR